MFIIFNHEKLLHHAWYYIVKCIDKIIDKIYKICNYKIKHFQIHFLKIYFE